MVLDCRIAPWDFFMRPISFSPIGCVSLAAIIFVIGCQRNPVPRSQASSPGNVAAKTVSSESAANGTNPFAAQVEPPVAASQGKPDGERGPAPTTIPAEEIVELLETARYKLESDDQAGADADYQQAGQLAARLLAHRTELTRKELRIAGIASYFQARVLARSTEPEQALAAIERAFAAGFEDLERLDQDEELSPVRALPTFAAFRTALESRLVAETRLQIQQQLKEFEAYPLHFRLPNLEGTEVASSEFRGKVVVLTFWGTWCVKCQAEVPILNRLQTAYGERGVQVVALSYEETDDNAAAVERIRKFQESRPMEYVCLLGDEQVRDQVRPPDDAPPEWVFPVTLLLDPQGRVRLHFTGEVAYRRLESAVQLLLEGEQSE